MTAYEDDEDSRYNDGLMFLLVRKASISFSHSFITYAAIQSIISFVSFKLISEKDREILFCSASYLAFLVLE